jgi:hypothetical protein
MIEAEGTALPKLNAEQILTQEVSICWCGHMMHWEQTVGFRGYRW